MGDSPGFRLSRAFFFLQRTTPIHYKQGPMAGPTTQTEAMPSQATRQPAVAGSFYPADAEQCRRAAVHFLKSAAAGTGPSASGLRFGLGAIVPHAGWICSGAIAGQSIAALAATRPDVSLVVVFGAVHTPLPLAIAALDTHQAWQEPGAVSAVAAELRRDLIGQSRWFAVNDAFHQREHAVEVVLPLVQAAWPAAKLLPVEVPPLSDAVEIGRATARAVKAAGATPVYLASSDLTHYGPAYQFAPAGIGEPGLRWAMENDRRLLVLVREMTPDRIVPEVMARHNACGAGAIAAMMAACIEHGAKQAVVLSHANSFQTLANVAPQRPDNAVGYAAVVLG
jgi:MEMO1 family protein